MGAVEEGKEGSLPSRTVEPDAIRDAHKAELAAREATTHATAGGTSFTPTSRLAGNVAKAIDPVLQAFFPNRDFSAGDCTIRQNVWPKRTPASAKDKRDPTFGSQVQGQQNHPSRIVEAKRGPSRMHVEDYASEHPEIKHDNCDSEIPQMPNSEPNQAVADQAETSGAQVLDRISMTNASIDSVCNPSAEAVRVFNSQYTIQKRPRAVIDLPSATRGTSAGIHPNAHKPSSTNIGPQASKLCKRGSKRGADSIYSPTADPCCNDALPRKLSSRLAAKAQLSNVNQQEPNLDLSESMEDDEIHPRSSRKIASGLAPAKRIWKKSEKPTEKTTESTNATLKAPEVDDAGDTMSTYSSLAPTRTPDWYRDIVLTSRSEHTLKRDDILTLRRLRTMYTNLLNAQSQPYTHDPLKASNSLRTFLHQLGLFDFHGKEKEIIKKSNILTDGTFTRILASPTSTFPQDIRNVAQALEARWWKGDTDPDLLRGVLRSKSFKARTSSTASSVTSYTTYTLDPTYPFRIPADQIGHNGLHVGAWWPLQICAVRDGAHGESESGIHGHQDRGAFSIVVSGGGYANLDSGDMLEYCGTAASGTRDMTPNTKLLITSHDNKRPVRVLRSAKGNRRWSPKVGVRYDGLYLVTSWKVIDESVSLVRFTMVRSKEQEAMKSEGPSRRPHAVEVEAVERDREMRRATV